MTDEDATEDPDPDENGTESGESGGDTEITADGLLARLDEAEEMLEEAQTEDDLDDVEAVLDEIKTDLAEADLPDADEEEDEESPQEEVETRISELRDLLEEQRGPYAEEVVAAIEEAVSTVRDTQWTDHGENAVVAAIEDFLETAGDPLGEEFPPGDEGVESRIGALEQVADTVKEAGLDPDGDAETIRSLADAADELGTDLDDAEEWDDLTVREKLRAEGFYDVLGHYKDFPPEWAALKEHESQGNVEMILLALDLMDSDFMERHCLEALTRMNDERAYEAMHDRASKRDRPGIKALGKMGAVDAVDTLVEYVDTDSDPQLQKVTFRALGEIGDERAVQPLANKLRMDNDQVRPYAARALGLIGDTRAVDPLADTLGEDENDTVRAAAAWALRQIGTERALEKAAEHESDSSYIVQVEAERAAGALDADDPEQATPA